MRRRWQHARRNKEEGGGRGRKRREKRRAARAGGETSGADDGQPASTVGPGSSRAGWRERMATVHHELIRFAPLPSTDWFQREGAVNSLMAVSDNLKSARGPGPAHLCFAFRAQRSFVLWTASGGDRDREPRTFITTRLTFARWGRKLCKLREFSVWSLAAQTDAVQHRDQPPSRTPPITAVRGRSLHLYFAMIWNRVHLCTRSYAGVHQ